MSKFWLILVTMTLVAAGIAFLPFPISAHQPGEKTIRVEASQYAFSPGEIYVNPGDQVTLELVSTDVVHGIYIDEYDLEVQADPGQAARLTFTANQSGMFRMRCNVTCGAMHPFMIGKLHVGQNVFFYRIVGLAGLAVLGTFAVWCYSSPRKAGVD